LTIPAKVLAGAQVILEVLQASQGWAEKLEDMTSIAAAAIFDVGGGPVAAMVQGLMMLAQPVSGDLLNAGATYLASLALRDSSEATKESNMSAQSWYDQFGLCSGTNKCF
jgi:hypothetical protein